MKDEPIQASIFESSEDSKLYSYNSSMEKLRGRLAEFGLTTNQCKIYIFLGKYGSKTAPEVGRALRIPRTETYHLLSTLQNKGIVSATFQHPIRFSALPLDRAIWVLVNAEKERVNGLEKQEKNLVDLWNEIPNFVPGNIDAKEEQFQILQGTNQIHSKIKQMVSDAKKDFFVLGSEKDYLKFYHSDFIKPLDGLDVDLKLLTSCTDKTMYVFDDVDRNRVKIMPNEIKDNLCFIVKDETELIFFIKNANNPGNQIIAVWTNCGSMIYSMKTLFNQVWSRSKNIHL